MNFSKSFFFAAVAVCFLVFGSSDLLGQTENEKFELTKEDSALLYPKKTNFVERMLKKGFAVFPVAFYAPETKFGGGLAGFYYFRMDKEDTVTRPSSANLVAVYTQNEQIIFQVPVALAFKENKTLLNAEFGAYRYPFQFYGTGNQIDLDSSEFYEPNILRIKGTLYKKVKENLFLGPRLRFERQKMRPFEEGGRLGAGRYEGEEGGNVLGLGVDFLLDKRDNIFTPTKGGYLNVSSYSSVDGLGSDYGMTEIVFDARKFFPLGKVTLATQLYVQHQSGEVPFFLLADMGGYSRMRGYFQGAFRDKVFTTTQAELRFPLFWRLGAVVFGGLGQVNDRLTVEPDFLRFAGGAGLRILFNDKERINLRIDYARGKDTTGFYFTIGEAF